MNDCSRSVRVALVPQCSFLGSVVIVTTARYQLRGYMPWWSSDYNPFDLHSLDVIAWAPLPEPYAGN
jgi:hypothetical protein